MRLGPAARVAATATGIVAVVYVLGVIVLNLVVSARLAQQNDNRIAGRLAAAGHDPDVFSQRAPRTFRGAGDSDADSAPVFFWLLGARQAVTAQSPGAPALPARPLGGQQPRDGLAVTVNAGRADPFRLKMTRDGTGWLVAGQSLAGVAHTRRLLLYAEVLAGPFVLLAMFFGCLAVGQRALAPVEQSRRRQLEFTADASHELRTPLSVIRAETDVALSTPRDAAGYRDALARIQGESARLRHLVDDMLWLARFDSRPPPPRDEPVDLATLAQACADRFRAVGPAITAETPAPDADQRAAGMDRPAGRGADGQRLPLCRSGRRGPDRRPSRRQPYQPHRRRQRPRHRRGRTAAAVRQVPPRDRAGIGRGPRAGHRRLDRALHRRPLAHR